VQEGDVTAPIRTAATGFALVAPSVYFISASVLKYAVGIGVLFEPIEALASSPERWRMFNLISPVLFMGGSLLALLLNATQMIRLSAHTEPGSLSGTVTIHYKPWNLAAAGLGFLVLFILTGYLVAENWQCWVGLKTHC
jgi:hypothetical protein